MICSKVNLVTLLIVNLLNAASIVKAQPQPLHFTNKEEKSIIASSKLTRTQAESISRQALEKYHANQLSKAIRLWQQALKIYIQLDDKKAIATHLKYLSAVSLKIKNLPQAITYLEQYLVLTRLLKDKSEEIAVLTTLANTYAQQGKLNKVIQYYQKALPEVRATKNRLE